LSRHTAGENLYHIHEPEVVVESAKDWVDMIDGRLPVMLPFLGILLLIIVITAAYEKI